jgi:hypothetical protein
MYVFFDFLENFEDEANSAAHSITIIQNQDYIEKMKTHLKFVCVSYLLPIIMR